MGTPLAVDHKIAGYLISILVPFGWIFIFYQLKKIGVGLLLGLGLYGLNLITGSIGGALFGIAEQGSGTEWSLFLIGFAIIIAGMVANFWIIWHFYSKWVDEWISTVITPLSTKDEEIKTLKEKVESLEKDKDEVKES